jgi:ribosome-associated heat shock protein Hsp15
MTNNKEQSLSPNETQRIDRWLHHVRLFKTRSQATKACEERRVKLNGDSIKPSKSIRVGDRLTIRYSNGRYINFQVLSLAKKNLSKAEAREYYHREEKELTDEAKELIDLFRKNVKPYRPKYKGRPTKKERREMEKFKKRFFKPDR